MKARKFIIYALLLVGALQSCEVTNRVPEDAITDVSFWTKVEDLAAYTRYFYQMSNNNNAPGVMTFPAPPGGFTSYPDIDTDLFVPGTQPAKFYDAVTVPSGSDNWAAANWLNIRRVNYFLSHYETVVGDAADINHYVGEVRWQRAHEYFLKVAAFGDVPWYEEELKSDDVEQIYKARDPRLFVIGKVIEDLEFAAANLKSKADAPVGRLHKDVALQLLSRVCLYEATWQKYRDAPESTWRPLMEKAAAAAKDIMDSGRYSIEPGTAPYTMGEDYPLMYKAKFIQEDLTGDAESILARVYNSGTATKAGFARFYSYGISKDFIEQFLAIDGKPIALSDKYMGDDSIAMEMANRDPRLWNIVSNRNNPRTLDNGVPTAPFYDVPGSAGDYQNTTGYISCKYNDPDPVQYVANNTTTDWYCYRYAETLMNYVEAMYELGQCTQAVLDVTVNQLRARLDYTNGAGERIEMGRLTMTPEADPMARTITGDWRYGYEIEPLLYEIRRERSVELAFEGHRWNDICRWEAGALINNPKTMLGMNVNDEVIASYTKYYGGTNPFAQSMLAEIEDWDGPKKLLRAYDDQISARRVWNDKYYLSPLPQTQLLLNDNLTQNPGY
jgi:hypothetical protein